MNTFLFINIIISAFNIFILSYAYSLNFFPNKWRKKVNQDTLVGLAIIFITMLTMFVWIIYFYIKLFQKLLSLQPPLFCIISPGTDKIENNVSSSPVGPATFANNLSPKITSSDKIPSLTNWQAFPFAAPPLDKR